MQSHPGFFELSGPFAAKYVATALGAAVDLDKADLKLSDVRTLSDAGPADLSFLSNKKYLPDLEKSQAGAVLVDKDYAERVPSGGVALVVANPYRALADALRLFYPSSLQPAVLVGETSSLISKSATIEEGAHVEPGAIIGPEAQIGRDSRICAGAVVGYRCRVGQGAFIGPLSTVTHSLIGDRVIVHSGVRIGQDGFGFAMGPTGHYKVPQIGRVIIENDVEIGANTTIDRGALNDTIIGEGSKIDNLVQIGHNVILGKHCVIVAQTGISGSTFLGDFVVMGGQSGAVGHIRIGDGAQIAGASHAKEDVPAGARMGGTPARPLREWARELAMMRRLSQRQ